MEGKSPSVATKIIFANKKKRYARLAPYIDPCIVPIHVISHHLLLFVLLAKSTKYNVIDILPVWLSIQDENRLYLCTKGVHVV